MNIKTLALALAFIPAVVVLSGCGSMEIRVSGSEVNPALFDGKPEVFTRRVEELKAANAAAVKNSNRLKRADALVIMGLDPKTKNFETVDRNTARVYRYGNTNLTSLADAQIMEQIMNRTTVERFKFVSRETNASFKAPLSVKYRESGYDLSLILVFEEGELQSAWQEGFDGINTSRSEILVNPFKWFSGSPIKR